MKPVKSLRARALAYLSRREMSKAELRRKLLPYAEETEEVDALLQELAERHWQSDNRYAESYVHGKSSRYGRLRLAKSLSQQGVDEETIAAVLPEPDAERRTACEVLRKKCKVPPATPQEYARAQRFLAYRGFSGEHIRYALQHAWSEEDRE